MRFIWDQQKQKYFVRFAAAADYADDTDDDDYLFTIK